MLIFISGVHGVGKTYFCEKAKSLFNLDAYSSSELIAKRKKERFPSDKLIRGIDDNQQYLIDGVTSLNAENHSYLLDGHFCLLNSTGIITRIHKEVFISLNPDAIILLTEAPGVIAVRRQTRDGVLSNLDSIQRFQDEEITYAKQISEFMSRPLCITNGASDIDKGLEFIQKILRSAEHGGKV